MRHPVSTEGHLPAAGDPVADAVRAMVRQMVREELQRARQEAQQDAPGLHPLEMTIARWARSRGHGYATARRWVKAAGLVPSATGKFPTAELDTLPRAAAPAAPQVADIAAERARRVAAGLLGPRGRSGGR